MKNLIAKLKVTLSALLSVAVLENGELVFKPNH